MNIVGVLCWYDEQPSMLAACAAGFARVCDTIVAVDGAYALYPGGRARSHPVQAEAILAACETQGAACVVHRPRDVFYGNEVEKRNLSLRLAAAFQPDWVMVIDADTTVMQTDPDAVRDTLANTSLLAATYTLLDTKDLLDSPAAGYARTTDVSTEWTTRARFVYRWTDDLEYGPAHWTVSGTYNGVRRWVRGPELTVDPPAGFDPVDAVDLADMLVVYHRREDRPLVRRQAADGYLTNRDLAGAEALA